jgi:ferredoxin
MKRNIVTIDESRCDGCGLCVGKCAEGALQIVDGKARLVSEVYCDGLGACLGECPRGAITVEEREAPAFDEQAVHDHLARRERGKPKTAEPLACGCPGTALRSFLKAQASGPETADAPESPSELSQWPVQLRLVPPHAPFLKGADILVCADCVPFALPDLHRRYLKGKAVLVGCPKLDDAGYYVDKLAQIIETSEPKSITIVHMEVPCCFGLKRIAEMAMEQCGIIVPTNEVTISLDGKIK